MKPVAIGVAVLFVILSITGPILGQPGKLVGTWELVSTKWTAPDGSTGGRTWGEDPQDKGRSLKILNATHFTVITHGRDGTFSHANGGPYSIEGDTYTERVTTSSNPEWIGWENSTKYKLQGDIWTIHYVNPYNKVNVEETWRRVKTN